MVTYGGNRPTVNDNEILTAEKFNDATRFWVTDELPDSGEDGDVVFVIGDSPVGGMAGRQGLGVGREMANDGGVWVKLEDAGSSAPGAAVIGDATADHPLYPVKTSSFEGDESIPGTEPGQAYDVYEFLGSGQLVVDEPGMVDALVIGAGGGGGHGNSNFGAGGAGAGGYVEDSVYLSAGSQTVTIGAGGAKGTSTGGGISKNGNPSALGVVVGTGGKCGNDGFNVFNDQDVITGSGRGGSGGNSAASILNGTAGFTKQGNSGGAGFITSSGTNTTGGGGGGAGSAGVASTAGNVGGNGGSGTSSFITGSEVERAGGGGGSGATTAGTASGGGGAGATSGAATDGTSNTGGGGGSGRNGHGGVGGSGIVIVRVAVPTMSYALRTKTTAPKTAHAARIEDGIVREVIVIPHLEDDDNKITEYCNKIGLPGTWVDTSYTGARRGKYAGVGDLFDPRQKNAEFTSPMEEME